MAHFTVFKRKKVSENKIRNHSRVEGKKGSNNRKGRDTSKKKS